MTKCDKRKKKKLIAAAFSGLLLCIVVYAAAVKINSSKPDIVAYVGQEAVYKEECLFYLNKIKLAERDELIKKSGKEAAEFHWNDEIGGKSGYEWLAAAVLDQAKLAKAVQQEARELGIIKEIDFQELMGKMEKENEERNRKKVDGEILYGVVEYSPEEYYDYFNSNLSTRCREKLIKEKALTATESEAELAYEKKQAYFGDKSFQEVCDSAQQMVLEEKYQLYIKALAEKSRLEVTDEKLLLQVIKNSLGISE